MTINECQGTQALGTASGPGKGTAGWAVTGAPGWEQWAAVWTPPAGAPGTSADDPTSETYTREQGHSASPGWTGFPACLPHNQSSAAEGDPDLP